MASTRAAEQGTVDIAPVFTLDCTRPTAVLLQVPGSPQLSAYNSLLQHAKAFIKERRRDIQQRQEAIMSAQADWKLVLAAMEEQQRIQAASGAAVPSELGQAVQQLRQLKGVLQEQIHQLNDETQQIKTLKARVSELRQLPAVTAVQRLNAHSVSALTQAPRIAKDC